jgi:hypothetical protein
MAAFLAAAWVVVSLALTPWASERTGRARHRAGCQNR